MVTAVSAQDAASRLSSANTRLFDNFETFLSLLTTQLKNQDPLSPLDSNEFTSQLSQMAGVEQQLLTNDLLTSLLAAQSGGLGSAANYLGRDVTTAWAATKFEGGQASWNYELGANAENATLEVVDSTGKVVWRGAAPENTTGIHQFNWDGVANANGAANAADGQVYSLKITATTTGGQSIDAQVLTRGRVTGVEMYDGEAYLTVGSSIVPLSSVIALEEATTQTQAEGQQGLASKLASSLNPLNLFS